MKKGPMEKRYPYDVESHPLAVTNLERNEQAITEEIKRHRLQKEKRDKAQQDNSKPT